MEKYDVLILGFGKAGKTLAADLGGQGKRVALIEQSPKMYGGTCINVACIPTKSLVNSAKIIQHRAPENEMMRRMFFQEAAEEKSRLTALLRGKNYAKLNQLDSVDLYTGKARMKSAHEVEVQLEDEILTLYGEKIVLNTGSRPVIPAVEGVSRPDRVFTSETLLEVTSLPRRLVIVGGGHIGLEFAAMYAKFGSQVTVLHAGEGLLPQEDPDISQAIMKVLSAQGITVHLNAELLSLHHGEEDSVAVFEDKALKETHEVIADAILLATGRRPNTEDLRLEAVGVETTAQGAVKVNDRLETSVSNIWAVGDVNGGPQFTYISLDDYRILRSQMNAGMAPYSLEQRRHVPHCLFLDPPYARVGLTEMEARAQYDEVKIVQLPAGAIPKAQVLRETTGLLKAVIDAKTGQILGAMLFCAEAHEMINTVKLAMDAKLPYTFLRDQIYTHPTMTEGFNDLFSL